MNDAKNTNKLDLASAREWLSTVGEVRLPRAWLVIGAVVVLALLIVALD